MEIDVKTYVISLQDVIQTVATRVQGSQPEAVKRFQSNPLAIKQFLFDVSSFMNAMLKELIEEPDKPYGHNTIDPPLLILRAAGIEDITGEEIISDTYSWLTGTISSYFPTLRFGDTRNFTYELKGFDLYLTITIKHGRISNTPD